MLDSDTKECEAHKVEASQSDSQHPASPPKNWQGFYKGFEQHNYTVLNFINFFPSPWIFYFLLIYFLILKD